MLLRRVIATLIAAVVVVVCVSAGLWQLRRLDEKRTLNETLLKRSALPAVEITELFPLQDSDYFTQVEVTGEFDLSSEVVLIGRPLDGKPGNHVLTPLHAEGFTVWVDRGWVPPRFGEGPVVEAPPPSGVVTVTGVLLRSESGPGTPSGGGRLQAVPRPDTKLLDRNLESPSLGLYVMASELNPAAPAALPEFAKVSATDEGPHLSYAIQWFVFATIALVGWFVLMRKSKVADAVDLEEVGVGEPERN